MSAEQEPNDPLSDELARIYRGLRPAPLADDAAEADPETARVVRWMQDAWRGLVVPPARVPLVRRRARPRLTRPVLAAAAGIVLLLGGFALAAWLGQPPERDAPTAHEDEGAIEILAVRPDQVELRSGPVRLVLLAPPLPRPTPTNPTEDPPGG